MDFNKIEIDMAKNKKTSLIFTTLAIISFIICIFCFFLSITGPILFLSIVLLIASIIVAAIYSGKCNEINDRVFYKYIYPKLEEAFEEFKYDKHSGIDDKIVDDLRFIDSGNRITTSNLMQGYYRGVSFVQSGVLCQRISEDSDGDTETTTTFSGRVIVLGVSLFNEDGYVDIVGGNRFYLSFNHMSKVTLDSEIERFYDIYVSNLGLSVPYKFLEYITTLTQSFSQYTFNFRIEKDRLYIAIEKISRKPYSLDSLDVANKDNIDFLIKEDSSFITNTISNILD